MTGQPTYELADFAPDGHLHTESPSDCSGECAGHLYALAQDAERTVALVRRAAQDASTGLRPPRLAHTILTLTEPETP